MKKDVERILRYKDLKKKYLKYSFLCGEARGKVLSNQEECKHEIIIITDVEPREPDVIRSVECLFCGKKDFELWKLWSIIKPTFINLTKLYSRFALQEDEKIDIIRQLFIEIALENPDMEAFQIVKVLQKDLNSGSKEFDKLAEERNNTFRKRLEK